MFRHISICHRNNCNHQFTNMQLKKLESFSLVELLVFVSILSIFFVMAASVVTVSLRNMKFNEHKLKASHYASQLEEWLRSQKEINWGGNLCNGCGSPANFTEIVSQEGNPTTFCFNISPIEDWGSVDACADYDLDLLFKREVIFTPTLTGSYVGQINASITVSWLDLGQQKSVTSNTSFSVPEQ